MAFIKRIAVYIGLFIYLLFTRFSNHQRSTQHQWGMTNNHWTFSLFWLKSDLILLDYCFYFVCVWAVNYDEIKKMNILVNTQNKRLFHTQKTTPVTYRNLGKITVNLLYRNKLLDERGLTAGIIEPRVWLFYMKLEITLTDMNYIRRSMEKGANTMTTKNWNHFAFCFISCTSVVENKYLQS